MSTIVMWLNKTLQVVLVAALGLAALPVANAYALGQADPVTPPAPGQISNDRLEQIWAKEQSAYDRLGTFFDRIDGRLAKAQELIDRAKANGKDVSALQAALDAFADAVKQAHPIYESAKGIISSHQGFDQNGKVTDREQAIQTVKDLGGKLREIRQLLRDSGRALREAIRAFREANRSTATPASGESGK
jgi:uncharacterized protein YoxC